ncbi:tensin-1-like isoform X1 [Styela clava]
MRIKSTNDVTQHDYILNSKDPPNSIDEDKMQNGHMKETALLSDRRGQRLESSRNQTNQQRTNEEHMGNGQNHVIHPTNRNDHELAVRTKVISVKRDIQPSSTNHRTKPAPIIPQVNVTPTSLHGVPKPELTPEQKAAKQRFEFNNNNPPSPGPRSPIVTTNNNNNAHFPSQPGSSDSIDGSSSMRYSNGSLPSTPGTAVSSSFPYPTSPPPLPSPNYYNMTSPTAGSHMSSYERNTFEDVNRLSAELSQTTVSAAPKFIRDTTSYWYKPDITREQALAILRDKPAGCFVVRDSRCFPGAFGLALKVDRLPPAVQAKAGADVINEYVRHFLVEMSSRGVRLKGCQNEPIFGSLSALVYQHSITPLALPCKLIIPTEDQAIPSSDSHINQNEEAAAAELLKQGAACNVVYIGSLDTESLTGPTAIENAITKTMEVAKATNKTSIVHFKVSPQGITLTDNERKIFFRRHYPTATVTFCGLDPLGTGNKKRPARRWDATGVRGTADAWIFGFVARKQMGPSDNTCHIFAELDSTQPARAIVNFVSKVLIGSHRQSSP